VYTLGVHNRRRDSGMTAPSRPRMAWRRCDCGGRSAPSGARRRASAGSMNNGDNLGAGGSALSVLGITGLVGWLVGRCTGPSRGLRGLPIGRRCWVIGRGCRPGRRRASRRRAGTSRRCRQRRVGCRAGRAVRGRSRWPGARRGAGAATLSNCTPRRPARTRSTSLRRPRDAHPDRCPRRPIVASTATGSRHCRSATTAHGRATPTMPQISPWVLHLPR